MEDGDHGMDGPVVQHNVMVEIEQELEDVMILCQCMVVGNVKEKIQKLKNVLLTLAQVSFIPNQSIDNITPNIIVHSFVFLWCFTWVSLIDSRAHDTDVCVGIRTVSGETLLQTKNSTGRRSLQIAWPLLQKKNNTLCHLDLVLGCITFAVACFYQYSKSRLYLILVKYLSQTIEGYNEKRLCKTH